MPYFKSMAYLFLTLTENHRFVNSTCILYTYIHLLRLSRFVNRLLTRLSKIPRNRQKYASIVHTAFFVLLSAILPLRLYKSKPPTPVYQQP